MSYISLDHLTTLGSNPGDKAEHVHLPLGVHHVQHGIYHNERTCSSYSRTNTEVKTISCELYSVATETIPFVRYLPTVDHNGSGVLRVVRFDFLEKLQHTNGGEGNTEIRPAGEVELSDKPLRLFARYIPNLRHNQTRASQYPKFTSPISTTSVNVRYACSGVPHSYLLDAKLADGVIYENHCVFHRNADVSVCPTALVRPVLGTLTLKHRHTNGYCSIYKSVRGPWGTNRNSCNKKNKKTKFEDT